MSSSPSCIYCRFFSKVRYDEGCWVWARNLNNHGYGVFRFDGRRMQAHRAAWLLFDGAIPYEKDVYHLCHRRDCVKPQHLALGTPTDYVYDWRKDWQKHGKRVPTMVEYMEKANKFINNISLKVAGLLLLLALPLSADFSALVSTTSNLSDTAQQLSATAGVLDASRSSLGTSASSLTNSASSLSTSASSLTTSRGSISASATSLGSSSSRVAAAATTVAISTAALAQIAANLSLISNKLDATSNQMVELSSANYLMGYADGMWQERDVNAGWLGGMMELCNDATSFNLTQIWPETCRGVLGFASNYITFQTSGTVLIPGSMP